MTSWGPENKILKKYLNYKSIWNLIYEIEHDKKPKMILNDYRINIRNKKYNKKIKKFKRLPNDILKNIFSYVEDDYIIGHFNFICKKYKHRWLNILEYIYFNGYDDNKENGLVDLIQYTPFNLDDKKTKILATSYCSDQEDSEDDDIVYCNARNNENLLDKYGYIYEYTIAPKRSSFPNLEGYEKHQSKAIDPKGLARDYINRVKNLKNIDQRQYFKVIFYIINKYKTTKIDELKFESILKKNNNEELITEAEIDFKDKCSCQGCYDDYEFGYYFFSLKHDFNNENDTLRELSFCWNDEGGAYGDWW